MREKDLYNKRVVPAFDEMYRNAICAAPIYRQFTFEEVIHYSEQLESPYKSYSTGSVMIPFASFYLSDDEQKRIIDKACKYLRRSLIWTRHSTCSFEEFIEAKRELEGLTGAARRRKMDELQKRYNLRVRSRDRDKVRFELCLTIAPNSNAEGYMKSWNKVEHLPDNLTFEEVSDEYGMDAASIYRFVQNVKSNKRNNVKIGL